MEDTVSPRVLAKTLHAGTHSASFAEAETNLRMLANLPISAERIRRLCGHIGAERIDEHDLLQQAYTEKPLLAQRSGKPADVKAPEIACVMGDGERPQQLDRGKYR